MLMAIMKWVPILQRAQILCSHFALLLGIKLVTRLAWCLRSPTCAGMGTLDSDYRNGIA